MKHWRVTKFNPRDRDSIGAFRKDDWTAFDDIGRAFGGVVLTFAEYEQTEERYISAAMHFAHEAGVSELIAVDVEAKTPDAHLSDGMPVNMQDAPSIVRAVLRCQAWCKLECRHFFYLHFGYDFYMYIGCVLDLPASIQFAMKSGLFVEACESPYLCWDS